MGLDQLAFAVPTDAVPTMAFGFKVPSYVSRERLQEWRNHWNLEEWMARLYRKKGGRQQPFNEPMRLVEEDLDALEQAIQAKELYVETNEGSRRKRLDAHAANIYWRELDESFLPKARLALKRDMAIVYTSWW